MAASCSSCGKPGPHCRTTGDCIKYLEAEHKAGRRFNRDIRLPATRGHGTAEPPGTMNKTERYYYETVLKPKYLDNQYQAVMFEALKLRLGWKCFYTTDFFCVTSVGQFELHEVKAPKRWEDDARVKIQVAASLYPWFQFFGCEGSPKVPFEITPIQAIPASF